MLAVFYLNRSLYFRYWPANIVSINYLCFCLNLYLSICLSASFLCISVCVSLYLSLCMSLCLTLFLRISHFIVIVWYHYPFGLVSVRLQSLVRDVHENDGSNYSTNSCYSIMVSVFTFDFSSGQGPRLRSNICYDIGWIILGKIIYIYIYIYIYIVRTG